MKATAIAIFLVAFVMQTRAEWIILTPSRHLYYSVGPVKSQKNYSGTLGVHYFWDNGYGVSLQTNFVRDLGWYLDMMPIRGDVINVSVSVGYSVVYNSSSFSLRLCIPARAFVY